MGRSRGISRLGEKTSIRVMFVLKVNSTLQLTHDLKVFDPSLSLDDELGNQVEVGDIVADGRPLSAKDQRNTS